MTTTSRPINIRMPENFLAQIDAYRRASADLPTRSEALRRLANEALLRRQAESPGMAPAGGHAEYRR